MMLKHIAMNIGLTVVSGRVSPCFRGVNLWILGDHAGLERKCVAETQDWGDLAWGQELMKRDVSVLICAGLNQFLWGALKGHGIDVVPNAVGEPDEVLGQWQRGALPSPSVWPPHGRNGCRRVRLRSGMKRRRGRH
jgi:predicted Fe-Mo cluster-binding NifX family protein